MMRYNSVDLFLFSFSIAVEQFVNSVFEFFPFAVYIWTKRFYFLKILSFALFQYSEQVERLTGFIVQTLLYNSSGTWTHQASSVHFSVTKIDCINLFHTYFFLLKKKKTEVIWQSFTVGHYSRIGSGMKGKSSRKKDFFYFRVRNRRYTHYCMPSKNASFEVS